MNVKGDHMDYDKFLADKAVSDPSTGLATIPPLNKMLFDFQQDIVRWALRRGRAAVFLDCGMGKTPIQLEWARHVPGRVLILAPLAVAEQTQREGEKFGITVEHATKGNEQGRIVVTNYEKMDKFDFSQFAGIVLDESSILKSQDGKTRTALIEKCRSIPFRLCCTATPAPNDYMELGNHAEFLGVMSRVEMLSMFFTHDGGETSKWRLKGHAQSVFWRWLCSFCVMARKPSDLGYDDDGFLLPEMHLHQHVVNVAMNTDGYLFPVEAASLSERIAARRDSVVDRVAQAAALVNATDTPFLVWCHLNTESAALTKAIPGAVEIKGSDAETHKERAMVDFSEGRIRVLVTKPSIAGWGLNWQHCHDMAFVGLSDSYEEFYQAVRRCWRFGQQHPVNVHIVTAETEGAVVARRAYGLKNGRSVGSTAAPWSGRACALPS